MKRYERYSFWLETANDDLTPRPALDGSIDVDVAILLSGAPRSSRQEFLDRSIELYKTIGAALEARASRDVKARPPSQSSVSMLCLASCHSRSLSVLSIFDTPNVTNDLYWSCKWTAAR